MNKLSPKITSLVKKHLRKASLAHPNRNEAKNKAKIAPALFRCQCGCCSYALYEGTSKKNLEEINQQFSDLIILEEKGHIDHIVAVREGKGELDWEDYIHSLFCDTDNLQYLSPECHTKKSKKDKK